MRIVVSPMHAGGVSGWFVELRKTKKKKLV